MNATLLFLILVLTPLHGPRALPRVAVFDFELSTTAWTARSTEPPSRERAPAKAGPTIAQGAGGLRPLRGRRYRPGRGGGPRQQPSSLRGLRRRFRQKARRHLSITGTVQKVSNLILNISIYVRDVANGNLIMSMSADMRGNTDDIWSRALRWLIKNRLLTSNFEKTSDNDRRIDARIRRTYQIEYWWR